MLASTLCAAGIGRCGVYLYYWSKNFAVHKRRLKNGEVSRLSSLGSRYMTMGAKGDWDFRICDLVKNPDGTDVLSLW